MDKALPAAEIVQAAVTHVPITIQIDQQALLDSWLAGRSYDETDGKIADVVISLVASNLATALKPEIAEAVGERIAASVDEIVREHLETPVPQTDRWGGAVGPPISLRKMIGEQAEKALRNPETRDGYRGQGGRTMVQRVIEDEVGLAFKKELKAVVTEAAAQAKAAVEKSAGEVIAETIDRARKGLTI